MSLATAPSPPRRHPLDVAGLHQRLRAEVQAYSRRRDVPRAGLDALPDRLAVRVLRAYATLRALERSVTVPDHSRADLFAQAAADIAALSADDAGFSAQEDPTLLVPAHSRPGTFVELVSIDAEGPPVERGYLVVADRSRVVVRFGDRSLGGYKRLSSIVVTADTPDCESAELHARRAFFDRFRLEWPTLRPVKVIGAVHGHTGLLYWFTCPCCGYPTRQPSVSTTTLPGIQVAADARACLLCGWSDAEGLDDAALQLDSIANAPYSLERARHHFREQGSMFASDDSSFLAERHRKRKVRRLKARVRALFDGLVQFETASIDAADAWRAAFALLDQFDDRMANPVGACALPATATGRGVSGFLGQRFDDLRFRLGL